MIDWEAWAAIGTLLAVCVAVWASRSGNRLIERDRKQRREDATAVVQATAARLALSLDYELYRYGNDLVQLANDLTTKSIWANPMGAVRHCHESLRRDALPLMNRFIDQLGTFGPSGAAQLTHVVATYHSLLEMAVPQETLTDAPIEAVRVGMQGIRSMLVKAVEHVRVAREVLAPHAAPFRNGVAELATLENDVVE